MRESIYQVPGSAGGYVGYGRGCRAVTTTVPFTVLDEAVHHLEESLAPWNVQIEVGTTEHIDVDRLREAAVVACNAHPLARARRRPSNLADMQYHWEIPDDVGSVPVEVADGDLASARTEFYGRPFDLTAKPPVRLLVGRGAGREGGDQLLVCVAHAAADGVGAVRIARSVCQAYRGETPDGDTVPLDEARAVLDDFRPSSLSGRADLLGDIAGKIGNTVDRPTRIAEDGGTSGDDWGFVHRTLDDELTETLVADRPDGVSVNDVLLAALHRTIEEWNESHGKSARKITTMVPVNTRPEEWFYEVVGMYALFGSVETRSRDRRDPVTTVESIAEQTTELTERDRAAAYYEALKLIPPGTPVGLKQHLPHLLRGVGSGLIDTAVLSNLGRVSDPPSLSEDGEDTLWFSPPCMSALPVGIGVATTDGTIRLAFRYTAKQFDADAASRFADYYVGTIRSIAEST